MGCRGRRRTRHRASPKASSRRSSRLVRHVEEAERSLRARLADGDLSRPDELRPVPELKPARAAVDDQTLPNRPELERRRPHPARPTVRATGNADPVPGGLPGFLRLQDVEREDVLRAEVRTELLEDGDALRARARLREHGDLAPGDGSRPHDVDIREFRGTGIRSRCKSEGAGEHESRARYSHEPPGCRNRCRHANSQGIPRQSEGQFLVRVTTSFLLH